MKQWFQNTFKYSKENNQKPGKKCKKNNYSSDPLYTIEVNVNTPNLNRHKNDCQN